MNKDEMKFNIYTTILRFLPYKITENLRKIFIDIDLEQGSILLTAYYKSYPSELELELLDDIITNSEAHLPNTYILSNIKLDSDFKENIHEFVIFSFYFEN